MEELPVIERVYVLNVGGGELSWDADTDQAWISLQIHKENTTLIGTPFSQNESRLRLRDSSRYWCSAENPSHDAGDRPETGRALIEPAHSIFGK